MLSAWCKRALKCLLFRMILTIFYTMSEEWERKIFNFEVFIVTDNLLQCMCHMFLRPACMCVSFVVECPTSRTKHDQISLVLQLEVIKLSVY